MAKGQSVRDMLVVSNTLPRMKRNTSVWNKTKGRRNMKGICENYPISNQEYLELERANRYQFDLGCLGFPNLFSIVVRKGKCEAR